MKHYKLLKDMPTIKAGTVFVSNGTYVTQVDCDTKINIEDILNFNNWFEEVRELEEWKPKKGEPFKMMTNLGRIVEHFCWEGSDEDRRILSLGNCYPLSTPDKVIDKEQRLIPQAMHRLKMAAKKAWFEFDGSNGPDWKNGSQRKYNIYYSHVASDMCLDSTWSAQEMTAVYFPTEESAQAIIDTMKDDLKLIFRVE